jgi:hypothetical protein
MRLYTRTGATALDDPEYGRFDAATDGGFDFPDDLSDRLYRFHIDGKPAWETDIDRQARVMAEEMERRRDPATLMSLVEQLTRRAEETAPAPEKPASAKRATKRAASSTPAE